MSIIGPSVPKWSREYKCQAHSENAILDAMDSFSRRPDGGGLPVHDAKALHVAPRMHGRAKEKHKVKAIKFVTVFCHCFTKFCSCISVTL